MAVNRKPRRPPLASLAWLLAALCVAGLWQVVGRDGGAAPTSTPTSAPAPSHAFLPAEAFDTLALIDRGGPFPHRQDGGVFQNREGLLPRQPRGHYREYTVATPGARDRGARRIVTGGDPPREWYYTADHYGSFRAFQRTGDRQ